MRASSLALTITLLMSPLACGDSTGDDGSSPTSSTSDPSGTTSSNPPGSSGDTSPPATGDAGSDGTTAPPATTDPGTTDGDPSTGPGDAESGPGVCEPAPPTGDVCLECVHANCCTAWQACMNDEPCACVVDCHVVQGNSLGMCSNSCNLDSDLYQALYFCGQGSCLGNCDWDCC